MAAVVMIEPNSNGGSLLIPEKDTFYRLRTLTHEYIPRLCLGPFQPEGAFPPSDSQERRSPALVALARVTSFWSYIMVETLDYPRGTLPKRCVRTDEKLLVSRREAAARLSISQRAVDYLIANKTLTTKRIGARVLIPTRDLRQFARADHPERLASKFRHEGPMATTFSRDDAKTCFRCDSAIIPINIASAMTSTS